MENVEQLLSVKGDIPGGLSSDQLIRVLDLMVLNSVLPLARCTNVVREWLTELMPLLVFDRRRRISKVDRAQLTTLMFQAVFETDEVRLRQLFSDMSLERSFYFILVDRTLKATASYRQDMLDLLTTDEDDEYMRLSSNMLTVEDAVGGSRTTLYSALQQSEYWFTHATQFKWMIAHKYYKLAWQLSQRAAHGTAMTVSGQDLFKNYILAISKAIDKYDSDVGVLTEYVKKWFRDAKVNPEFGHQYDISYSMPTSRRRSNARRLEKSGRPEINLAYNIDTPGLQSSLSVAPDDFSTADHSKEVLRRMATMTKRVGLFMLTAGVEYPISEEELGLLQDSLRTGRRKVDV